MIKAPGDCCGGQAAHTKTARHLGVEIQFAKQPGEGNFSIAADSHCRVRSHATLAAGDDQTVAKDRLGFARTIPSLAGGLQELQMVRVELEVADDLTPPRSGRLCKMLRRFGR
jgi:hypothetical protein